MGFAVGTMKRQPSLLRRDSDASAFKRFKALHGVRDTNEEGGEAIQFEEVYTQEYYIDADVLCEIFLLFPRKVLDKIKTVCKYDCSFHFF